MIISFHDNMRGTVPYDGFTSKPAFYHQTGMRTNTHFLWNLLFDAAETRFRTATEGIYMHTRADGKIFTIYFLKTRTKIGNVTVRYLLFADNAAVAPHTRPT